MSRALGRYELLRPLARGGMAEVFLARRRAAGVEKWLVVKRMRRERAGDARFLDLFVREARLSMSLAHQNIVPVFDFGRIDDQVFIAMERVEGKDLGSSLGRAGMSAPGGAASAGARGGALPPVLAAFVAAECCQALDYAHRRRGPDGVALGIVHRDVTPRNVLLSWSGEVKLTDFGIAALAGDEVTKVIGTAAYMAPEQARGEPTDPRTDVYAIGLVLREALTGVRARPGDDRETLLSTARRAELAPWPEGVESPLRAIIEKATAAERDARYPDARSMLEDLDGFIVAERSARKIDAPTRQLAAWLAEVWQEEREETAIDEAIEASHLVSFLDDGALDVIGTGTVRSMAATATEDAKVVEVVAAPAAAKKKPPLVSWRFALGAAIALAGGLAVTVIALENLGGRGPNRGQPREPAVATATPTPAPAPIPDPPSAAPIPEIPHPIDRPRIHRPAVKPVDAPAAAVHDITINSQPWSNFTIDNDPTLHQTMETVKLAPGPHHFHFANPAVHVEKDVTKDIPDHDFKWVEKLGE